MSQKPKTVLIVDDDEGMRDTLTAILKREYRVLRVASGEAGLAVLNKDDVDLVLLDVRLPGISGFEVLRIVKENYSLIEVIMISAINEIETAVQAMKHGAYHYITKDFDYDQLRAIVRNASDRQDLNRQVMTLSAQATRSCSSHRASVTCLPRSSARRASRSSRCARRRARTWPTGARRNSSSGSRK
jgi:DNA-binding NtrC family response regulator